MNWRFWEKREGYTDTIINALIQAAEGSARNCSRNSRSRVCRRALSGGFLRGQDRTRTGSTRPLFPR